MVTCSLEFLCFLGHFHVPWVKSKVGCFFLKKGIPQKLAYKSCFLKQWYVSPGRQSQLSALILKYLQNRFEERERKSCPQKLISIVYLIWLTLPPKIFLNQLIATGAKFYGVSIFCGWSDSPPRSFMGIKAQSVMCGTVVVSLSLFVFGERRLWPNSNMLED